MMHQCSLPSETNVSLLTHLRSFKSSSLQDYKGQHYFQPQDSSYYWISLYPSGWIHGLEFGKGEEGLVFLFRIQFYFRSSSSLELTIRTTNRKPSCGKACSPEFSKPWINMETIYPMQFRNSEELPKHWISNAWGTLIVGDVDRGVPGGGGDMWEHPVHWI